jgi:drug/metabolite transporter (DMT)-like permease
MGSNKNKLYGIAAACIAHTIWGFSFIFSKTALQFAAPAVLLAVRFILAFTLMNLLLLTGKFKLSFKGKKVGSLLLLGLLEPVLYFFCESYGILYTNATLAGLIISLNPIAAIIFSSVFLGEHPTRRRRYSACFPLPV